MTRKTEDLPDQHFVIESKAEIGASVSRDLKRAALLAIAISLAGIVVYLAWRFDHRFGVAAAVATFHDVLTVLGISYLLDKEITLQVVTALLTLAGYSLTDTVVVFDRIRENLQYVGSGQGILLISINKHSINWCFRPQYRRFQGHNRPDRKPAVLSVGLLPRLQRPFDPLLRSQALAIYS